MAAVLRPAPAPLAFRPVSGLPVRRPGSVSSGSPPPIHPVVRMLPPSGASTPAPEETCPSCGNAFMPDAIFCRYCGQKREVETQSVQSINYNSLFSGPMSPSDGVNAAFDGEVAPALYGVGFSGSVAPASSPAEVYTSVAAATPLYSGIVSGPATPSATPAPVYHVDPALYGGPSGTMTPTPSGARVYHVEPPLYSGGLSGTVTPTSGGAPVYHVDPLLCGGLSGSATPSLPPVNAELGASVRGGMSGTVTPTSGGAPVITYPAQPAQAAQPGLRPRPPMMEPTTLAAQASLPPDTSCEVPVTPTTSATSAPRISQCESRRSWETHRSTKNELTWILSNYFRTDSQAILNGAGSDD